MRRHTRIEAHPPKPVKPKRQSRRRKRKPSYSRRAHSHLETLLNQWYDAHPKSANLWRDRLGVRYPEDIFFPPYIVLLFGLSVAFGPKLLVGILFGSLLALIVVIFFLKRHKKPK